MRTLSVKKTKFLATLTLGVLAGCNPESTLPDPGSGGQVGATTGGAATSTGGATSGVTGGSGPGPSSGGASATGGATSSTGGSATATGGSGIGGSTNTGGSTSAGGSTNTGGVTTAGGGAAGAKSGGGAAGSSTGGVSTSAGTTGVGGVVNGVVWPNDMSKANSDPWLATNHDRITQLQPRVLVIDLENTSNAPALVDKHIAALKEATSFHKYKDPNAQPAVAYQLVKVAKATKGSRIDYNSWNTQAFADANLQLKDPADPSGPNLTLCGLFEKGVIHEVWCMAGSDPKCGETQEAKQVYDANGAKVAGRFVSASNGDNINSLGCKVTARITDFNSARGTGCHQHAMGHAWERYMDANAVPALGKQAKRFLNWDMNTRLGAPFSNFYSACNSNASQLTDCIVWDSNIHAKSGPSASRAFDIPDMSGGCGNSHFYPNTTGTYSYDTNNPDPEVLTSCENYGLKNGPDGKDLKTPYTNAMTDRLYGRSSQNCPANQPACDDDCGGHGSTYLYQNFPGPGTIATNDDGTPMRNWWVYLFY